MIESALAIGASLEEIGLAFGVVCAIVGATWRLSMKLEGNTQATARSTEATIDLSGKFDELEEQLTDHTSRLTRLEVKVESIPMIAVPDPRRHGEG